MGLEISDLPGLTVKRIFSEETFMQFNAITSSGHLGHPCILMVTV